jgi:hypothetical protein
MNATPNALNPRSATGVIQSHEVRVVVLRTLR